LECTSTADQAHGYGTGSICTTIDFDNTEHFGYFKVSVWANCNWRLSFWHNECGCTKFEAKDNLKYLEMFI
jgi:hypothetical protein